MPSLRARAVNRFLRSRTKRLWRPGLDIAEIRRHTARMDALIGRRAPPVAMEPVTIAGVPATWFGAPELASRGTLLYLHGGAWCLHLPAIYRRLVTALSALTGMRVLMPDYRLAPEHRFPAAVDDSYDALCWVADNAAVLGGNGKLLVAGESAGGNLAAVMCLKARDEQGPAITAQVLLYPVTDADLSRDSYRRNGDGYLLSTDTMRWFWDLYCPVDQRTHPHASPLRALNHRDLPPAVIATAEFDPLCDEGAAYAGVLAAAGVGVTCTRYAGLIHDFMATAGMFACSRVAANDVYAAVRRYL